MEVLCESLLEIYSKSKGDIQGCGGYFIGSGYLVDEN